MPQATFSATTKVPRGDLCGAYQSVFNLRFVEGMNINTLQSNSSPGGIILRHTIQIPTYTRQHRQAFCITET